MGAVTDLMESVSKEAHRFSNGDKIVRGATLRKLMWLAETPSGSRWVHDLLARPDAEIQERIATLQDPWWDGGNRFPTFAPPYRTRSATRRTSALYACLKARQATVTYSGLVQSTCKA